MKELLFFKKQRPDHTDVRVFMKMTKKLRKKNTLETSL